MFTQKDFINFYAERNETTKTKAKEDIARFIDTFKAATFEGGVNLLGFMKSEVVDQPAKTVKNPATQEDIQIPARRVVKVKISKKFRDMESEED